MKHLEHRERHNECEKKKRKAEWLINERTKVVSFRGVNERATHANKKCYPQEYLICTFLDLSLCMKKHRQ